ncbi:hypothetical protein HER32_00975 [Hymenobacter sp. BT18]|uniref:hypothetical protein n=1 Tax=Hymenobacter sp. BT18 TaxID=2835648 RepID=UPI00143EDD24|nr:hypothetical protein [Hymenobacter sp. BT18]QIX59836.1 hypothetical protein HER32_00975 [Hymenobacter sp. BT18]
MNQTSSDTLDATAVSATAEAPALLGGLRGHSEAPSAQDTASPLTLSADDSAWNILYGAIVKGLGTSPQNFQLVYPMTSWNWPTNNLGYTSAAQYDFCATIPQWSATGAYVSSGATYDGAYQQFLNCIMLDTTDPALQQKIVAAQNNLTQSTQNYQTQLNQATAAYNSQVTGNNPTFTAWLASPAGFAYNAQLTAAMNQVTENQAVLTALTQQQKTPNIANAQAAAADQDYYTKLSDPTLSGNPPVPSWSLALASQQWVNQVQGGGATPGSISFGNNSAAYSYSNTWAQGSTSVGSWFWQVYANASWQQISEFYTDSSLTCTISFKAWDTIGITPGKWYSGTNVFKNGPFTQGYTAYEQAGSTWMFGAGGVVPCFKTAMLVCYQPTISISVSQSTYQQFQQNWSASGGIQVGPFQIGGSSGGSSMNWSQSGDSMTLEVTSTSLVPLIFGVNIAVQPQ